MLGWLEIESQTLSFLGECKASIVIPAVCVQTEVPVVMLYLSFLSAATSPSKIICCCSAVRLTRRWRICLATGKTNGLLKADSGGRDRTEWSPEREWDRARMLSGCDALLWLAPCQGSKKCTVNIFLFWHYVLHHSLSPLISVFQDWKLLWPNELGGLRLWWNGQKKAWDEGAVLGSWKKPVA